MSYEPRRFRQQTNPSLTIPQRYINHVYQKYCKYLFYKNLKRLTKKQKKYFDLANIPIQILYGSAASGKSYYKLGQQTPLELLKGDRNFLVCRQTARSSHASTFNEVCKGIRRLPPELAKLFKINKSDFTITAPNGYQILFVGLQDVEKVKSITPAKGVLTDIIIEEASEITEESFNQLLKRLRGKTKLIGNKRVVLMFNPILKTHWIYKRFFAGRFSDDQKFYASKKLLIQKTTYIDNINNLTRDDVDKITLRNPSLEEKDDYVYQVYALGNWGILGDLIYTNWTITDLSGTENRFSDYYNGQDFGFNPNPSATVRTAYENNTIYVLWEYGNTRLSMTSLAGTIKPKIKSELITCDNQENYINELWDLGVKAVKAKKGPGSVKHGIEWLRDKKIVIDKRCVKTINEISTYQNKKDPYGQTLDEPLKKDDHFMDALRYAYDPLINNLSVKWG